MKQKLTSTMRLLTGSRGVALIALVFLGVISMMPGWVNAQSDTTSTFTSPLPGSDDHHGGHHGGPNDEIRELLDSIIDRDEVLADVLGITVEELTAAREDGVSLHELIDQAGLDEETVHTEIQTAVTEAVQQAVTDGTITQEQADAILNPPTPPQQGNEHGHDGHHQRPDPADDPDGNETPTPAVEETTIPEATPEATTVATNVATDAPVDSPAADGPDHHRPHHDQGPAAQNDETATNGADNNDTATDDTADSSTTSSDTTTSDTTSNANEEPAANEHQPPGEPHNHPDSNHRPRR